jgi:signal peptidase I
LNHAKRVVSEQRILGTVPVAIVTEGGLCPDMKKKRLSPLLAVVFFALVIYLFNVKGIKFYLVPSESMSPTLKQSDYIAGFAADAEETARYDIVVFTSGFERDFYVKRVIGMPGEVIQIFNGYVYINGRLLDEPYVKYRSTDNFGPIKIKDGAIFVLGDNRVNSVDSRIFGPVSLSLVEAKVSFIYNPINRIGTVK